MTPKERCMAAFDHKPTDRVPVFHGGFCSDSASIILGREAYVGGGIQQWREARALWQGEDAHAEFLERSLKDAYDLTTVLDQDMVRVGYWRMPAKPARKIDEHTYMYGDPDDDWWVYQIDLRTEMYQIIDRAPKPELTMEDLEREVEAEEAGLERMLAGPPPGPASFKQFTDAMEVFPDRAVRGSGLGINVDYKRPVWLEAIALIPDVVERHLEVQAQRAMRTVKPQADLDIRLLGGGGDFASNKGPFYSPAFFHKAMMPRIRRVTDLYHELGCYLLYASDGDLWPVADDLFGAAAVDGFFEIDARAGMDLRKLRERFPDLTLMGGVSSYTLHLGTVDEVIAETEDAIAAADECGSIIVGASNYPMPGTPAENLTAMIETIDKHR
jgi:hypothetical protein